MSKKHAVAAATPARPAFTAPELDAGGAARIPDELRTFEDWPLVRSLVERDERVEERVARLVARMTVAEKVGQIVQPEISAITPDEVREFHIGSVLNGGGAWPGKDKHASLQDWLALADAYWQASVDSTAHRIPVLWGIDAVHGNGNVFGATLFPHNIGLGAAHDPKLVRRICAATARQIRATGQDWAFAPTVAVPQDDRWGRTYEGYSEDPRIALAYGYEAVRGLQGTSASGPGEKRVVASVKHWIGDGATDGGVDQGVAGVSEDVLRNVHGQGYFGALAAGSQTVMASFNSWDHAESGVAEGKVHGSHVLLTEVLKQKMGFDGFVVSDWNGVGQVEGCTNDSCARAINAGIDMVMVPTDWKALIANTLAQVESGEIPMARLDDAVTRILRVKARCGVLDAPKPSQRKYAGDPAALDDRRLARKAARKSLVLLKNNDGALPIAKDARVLVVGKSASSLQNQTGGWSLTWQGTGNTNDDFPSGATILEALRTAVSEGEVVFDETGGLIEEGGFDVVVAVIGETPYAEGFGDLGRRSLQHSATHPEDLAVLERVSGHDVPVVTVLLSGRPLWVNPELNRSDAFVAAWLPGTEGAGVADVLVQGKRSRDFTGRLSYSWPASPWDFTSQEPLFPLGYGLSLSDSLVVDELDETVPPRPGSDGNEVEELAFFDRHDIEPYAAHIAASPVWSPEVVGDDVNAVRTQGAITVSTTDLNVQHDARHVVWSGDGAGQFYLQSSQTEGRDLRPWFEADSALVFDIRVHEHPSDRVVLSMHSLWPAVSDLDITEQLRSLKVGFKATLTVPLRMFENGTLEPGRVNTPFLVYTEGSLGAAFGDIRWTPGAGAGLDGVGVHQG